MVSDKCETVQVGSVRGVSRGVSNRVGSVRFGSVRFGSVRFVVLVGLVQFESVQIVSSQVCYRVNWVQHKMS